MEFEGFLESGEELLAQVRDLTFQPLRGSSMMESFYGCNSICPMYAEITIHNGLDLVVVLDGNSVGFYWFSEEWVQGPWQMFEGDMDSGFSEVSRQEPVE